LIHPHILAFAFNPSQGWKRTLLATQRRLCKSSQFTAAEVDSKALEVAYVSLVAEMVVS
jgi:hypothetical protein